MSSLEETLLNGAPIQSDISSIADALRRRSQLGTIGVASGLPGVSEAGQDLVTSAANDTAGIVGNQQFSKRQAQQESEHQDTVAQAKADLAERERADKANEDLKAWLIKSKEDALAADNPVVAQNQKLLEPQVQKLSVALTKSKIPEFEQALDDYEQMVQKYTDPKTGKVGSIPGIGGLYNYGVFSQVANQMNPTGEAAVNRGNAQRVLNTFLNARFGARGGTQSNVDLMKQELGQSVLTGQPVDVKLMNRARELIKASKNNIFSGVSPAARAMYKHSQGDNGDPIEEETLARATAGQQLLEAESAARQIHGYGGGAPAAAIAMLKAHPELAPQFQKKFGYLPK